MCHVSTIELLRGSRGEEAHLNFGFFRWSLLTSAATAALIFLLATFVHAQDSQFFFDPNGNLLEQKSATTAPPQIIGQPQNRIVQPGEATSFFVVAAETRALTYQWRFNGTNIGGATSDALLRQNVTTNNEGEYRVVLTNPSGSVTSAPAMLFIDSDADGIADSWERTYFTNLTQNATADFDHDGASNLQEFLDGTNPTNSVSVRYRIFLSADGGTIIKTPDQSSYTNGETVTLTAVGSSLAPFHGWLGDVVTRSNSITLVMTNNKSVFARFTPIVFTWAGSSGDWNVAANWSPSLVPGSNETVIINSSTVTLNTPADCNDVTLGAGSPTLTGSGNLTVRGTLLFLSGTISSSGNVIVLGNLSWSGGTMSGSGRAIIESGATLNVPNPSSVSLNTRTLENGGTVLWTGAGSLGMNNGAVITNRAGALFEMQNALAITANNGSVRFDNVGIFRKSVNLGTITFPGSVSFNNSGMVEIQTGTLSLIGGGTHSGNFTVPAGTALALGGTHNAGAGSSITGGGQITISSGTANLAGLVNVTGSNTFSGGTANLTGNYICTNNTIAISGGEAKFSGTGLVSPTTVSLSSGALSGTGVVTVMNAMSWTGGSMNDAGRLIIAAGATLQMSGALFLNSHTLENGGTTLWTGTGSFVMNPPAAITNRVGALFEIRNAVPITANNGLVRIDNAGTLRKTLNSGTTTSGSVTFNNFGTVDIRSGILVAGAGYVSSPNALLNCALGGTTVGAGYGQLQVGGTVTLNGALSVELINGFVPATNNTFAVLTASTRNGAFVNFSYPSNAVTMQVSNTANSVIVRVTDVFSVPQPAPLPAGVISWWRAEGNALDNVGTNHGVLTNGATFAAGQVGQAFALDGVNNYVQVPDSASLRPVSVTIEAWVKFFATNGIRIVLVKPLGSGRFDSYGLALQDGAVLAAVADNSGFGPFLTGPAITVPGQWYHLAYTFDDSSKQQVLYLNGIPVASGTANKTMSYDAQPVLLGADVENGVLSFFHHGQIDEASIYNRALTRDEIATIYNAGAAGKQLGGGIPPPMLLTPEIVGSSINVKWTAVSNAVYRLEFNPDLTNLTNWNAIPGDVIGVSNTASKLDPLTPSNRLYRVRVIP